MTKSGRAVAAEVARKHDILKSFFVNVLGVDKEIAQQAACKAEHALGPEIIARLLNFIKYVTQSNRNGRDVAKEFQRFHKKQTAGKGRVAP